MKPEDRLILLGSKNKLNSKEKKEIDLILDKNLDWEYILTTLKINKIAVLFYDNILDKKIPKNIIQKLSQRKKQLIMREKFMQKELFKLLDLLKKEDIEPVVMKGVVLANLYPAGARPFADLDILIKKEELQKVKDILLKKGYKLYEHSRSEKEYLEHHKHLIFFKKKKPSVEVHWDIVNNDTRININPLVFINNSENIIISKKEVNILKPEHQFLHLCIHLIEHKFILSLRYYLDIKFLLKKYKNKLDWDEIINISKQMNISNFVFHILNKTKKNLGLNISSKILNHLRENSSSFKLFLLNIINRNIIIRLHYPNRKYNPCKTLLKETLLSQILPFKTKNKKKNLIMYKNYLWNDFKKMIHLKEGKR